VNLRSKTRVAIYSEKEIRYVRPIAAAILGNPAFRSWILERTRFRSESLTPIPAEAQARLRSKNLKNPYWFNYWCSKDRQCACRVGTGIETDILIILAGGTDRRIALHVEVKRPDEALGDGQAESYPRRAACWSRAATRPRYVPEHDDFVTLIACGRNLEADARLMNFDAVLFHDEIQSRFRLYADA